jgi:hypothetical protein
MRVYNENSILVSFPNARMTFLNPLVLIGLAAAAIPILLHLFNLRRLEKIEFSTLTFLKELQKTKIRRLKLRQLLLLFLRTLLIVVIVTAFSRPTLKSSYFGATNAQAKTTAVFVVDNSYSMTSLDEDGQLLKQAKEEANSVLRLMKEGDEVYVIPSTYAGSSASIASSTGLRDFAAVRAEIRDIEPSYVHGTIENALRLAARFLASSKNLNREVYVFSDFKMGGLRNNLHNGEPESIFPDGARFFLVPIGKKVRQNLAFESLKIDNALFGVGNPLTIQVKVANWGTQNVSNEIVSVFLNGTRVAQKALDIQAQNSAETEFSVTPTSTGYLDGVVELQDDDLEFDNQRSFAVHIPERLKVLLVGSSPDYRYARLALVAQPTEGESIIKLSAVPAERLSTNEIKDADVIVFTNVRDLSSAQRTQVRSFVESGGGVVYFPGSQTDSSSFQSVWANTLNVPPFSSIVRIRNQSGQPTSVLDFDRIDYRHPIFEGMFAQEQWKRVSPRSPVGEVQHSIESPTIFTHVRYQANVQSVPIITLADGSPFMLEQRVKKGVVILFSVSATTDWSNFPLKGIFVPLIHSAVTYAAQQQSIPSEVTVGNAVDMSFRNVTLGKVTVQNPDKVDIAADVAGSHGQSTLHFRGTSLPGIYSVKSDNTLLKQFVVALNPEESNTVRADSKAIESMLYQLGVPRKAVETISQGADVQKAVVQSRVGIELWKYFVAAALLIGLIESFVARTGRKELSLEGFASTTTSDTIS